MLASNGSVPPGERRLSLVCGETRYLTFNRYTCMLPLHLLYLGYVSLLSLYGTYGQVHIGPMIAYAHPRIHCRAIVTSDSVPTALNTSA